MVKIKDVAKRAGVSSATVSRVINGQPYVTNDVRDRVMEAVHFLSYRPNRVAQRLRASRSHLVGVLLSNISNPFYMMALEGIEHAVSRQGLSVLVCNSAVSTEREDNFISLLLSEEVAGLVIAPCVEESEALQAAVESGLSVVVIDRRMSKPITDVVLADNQQGARLAIQHLLQQNHRRIAIINGPQHLTSGRERYQGYLQMLNEACIPHNPSLIRFGDFQQDSGYELMRDLIAHNELPFAVFIANNLMTIGALNAIHEAGLVIPDDIAVIGFDDLPWAISLNPSLTTVSQPAFDIGIHAAELLFNRITYPDRPARTIVLNTQLVIRESGLARSTRA
jgi:DNA-binding LacI/PurR family transcriptional regulator